MNKAQKDKCIDLISYYNRLANEAEANEKKFEEEGNCNEYLTWLLLKNSYLLFVAQIQELLSLNEN